VIEMMGEGMPDTSLPLASIEQVKQKLACGAYHTEAVSCFCGSADAVVLREKDRYGFDHRMLVCRHCGLIYASPRMTEESYREFYRNEYRPIYDFDVDQDENFAESSHYGSQLKDYLDKNNLYFETVFDLGCNSGGWLEPFKEAGAKVYGVDYAEAPIAYGRKKGLSLEVGGLEEIERLNKKADLIIASHFLEHCIDLHLSLEWIRNLLTDRGYLFVCVPNLYIWQKHLIFQNAHPYQFTQNSLAYVMECCGFKRVVATEFIWSLWCKSETARSIDDADNSEVEQILKYLESSRVKVRAPTEAEMARLTPPNTSLRRAPLYRMYNKYDIKDRIEYIQANFRRKLPNLKQLEGREAGRAAVIIGGGPSVNGQIKKIDEIVGSGARVIVIDRMTEWAFDNLYDSPDYICAMDSNIDVLDSFPGAAEEISTWPDYLIASQCHPAVFEKLRFADVYIYNTHQESIDEKVYQECGDLEGIEINGGGSVILCAMSIAMTLWMRELHFFGCDLHVTEAAYAQGILGAGTTEERIRVRVGKRDFITTAPYLAFAQQFFKLVKFGRAVNLLDSVKVYGDSLLTALSREDIAG